MFSPKYCMRYSPTPCVLHDPSILQSHFFYRNPASLQTTPQQLYVTTIKRWKQSCHSYAGKPYQRILCK